MSIARHARPAELAKLSLEEIAERYVARFHDRKADWNAFEDAKVEGYKRAQHRYIGAGGSGKHNDVMAIPPRGFTLSIMFVPVGQGNAAHTHEVEEVFFVLEGILNVFLEDEGGRRVNVRLGKWDGISCPPGVIHGYENDGVEPVYFQVMLGRARPETMGYADQSLFERRAAHLTPEDVA
jgi:oxalate decarboxylase/phosphoglucose isomerase-like protein (cupin superfamily)